MYLKTFTIENVKSFGEPLTINFEDKIDGKKVIRRWNVIVGENGTGKSTLLQAIAIALMGDDVANRLRGPQGWVRLGAPRGQISAQILAGKSDKFTGESVPPKTPYETKLAITGEVEVEVNGVMENAPKIVFEGEKKKLNLLKFGPWNQKPGLGWLAAGYGPFRRLSGGSQDAFKFITRAKKDARFITLFREDAALEDIQDWLKEKDHRSKSDDRSGARARRLLEMVTNIINHLLPEGVSLAQVNPSGVFFNTPYGKNLPMNELSDGYRSMLALAGDLLHRMDDSFESLDDWIDAEGNITAEGVVLIDELDAHLHPIWQREIGFWLQEKFPNLQFIVATHSPFIAQAADAHGIYVLRQKDLQDGTKSTQVWQDEDSVRGWRAEQILAVLFDLSGTRSLEAEKMIRLHAELAAKRKSGSLSGDDEKLYQESDDWIKQYLSPPGDTPDEIRKYQQIQKELDELLSPDEGKRHA